MRTGRQSQEQRRTRSEQLLLAAAAEVIVQEGFAAATCERISQKAGYSPGLVTQRFGSKDGLIVALIDFLGKRIEDRLEALMRDASTGIDEISAYFDAFLTQIWEDPLAEAYFIMLSAAVSNHQPQKRYFFEYHERSKARFIEAIRKAQDEGLMDRKLDPVAAATIMGCVQFGVAMQLLIDPQMDVAAIGTAVRAIVTSFPGYSAPP